MTQQQIQENIRFKQRCILNLDGVDFDTPIYRVYQRDRLLQALTLNRNTLVRPSLWDDPFENLVFRSGARLLDGTFVPLEAIRQQFYGQCWTLNQEETDALWRIYSPDKDGVRVTTTLRKLFDGFYNPYHDFAMISFYIGKILYDSEQNIKEFLENPDNLEMIFDTSGAGAVNTLLIKRIEFLHENEIRIIYRGHEQFDDLTKDIYQYDIDMNVLFEEFLIDPRMTSNDCITWTENFRAAGYLNPINQSRLYQLPNLNLRLNH